MAKETGKAGLSRGYLAVGNIVGVHGIRGEVKVELLTDFPERFSAGATLYLGPESQVRPVRIEAARPHKGMMLVKFAGVPARNAAELLRDTLLLIPEEQAMPLGEGENYAHDLIGLRVETAEGRALGTLVEILYTAANDVYVVRRPGVELLIPALKEVVLTLDLGGGRMVVQLPDGLEAPAGKQDEEIDDAAEEAAGEAD
jgi:16S rRNA processing protein RimM